MTSASTLDIEPIDASFGAVINGVKLAGIDEAASAELRRVWLDYGLLIFPDQHLSNPQQVEFAKRFGDLEFDLAPISNVRKDGSVRSDDSSDGVIQVLKGNMGWHHDSTYMPVQAMGAVFTAHVVPSKGGETGWADMRAAYEALDDSTRQLIENRSACHSLRYSQAKMGYQPAEGGDYSGYGFHDLEPPCRPLVKVHPETGRKNLIIGRHAFGVSGLSEAESERLLEELVAFACQPPRIYHHHWQVGDAVLWDNRRLMHRACPWDMTEPRIMYHARIAGDRDTEYAAHA